MFSHTSRYYSLETVRLTTVEGRDIAYKRRRFVPDRSGSQTLVEVVVTQGDRLDNITGRTLGDPEHFWRVCDANNAMNPVDLTHDIGRRLRIPLPQFESQ